jgi:hypothetical protein
MSQEHRDPTLMNLEAALAGLTPRPAALDRDRVMFRAGQRSAERRPLFWPAAAAILALSTGVLSAFLLLRSEPPVIERIVYLPGRAPNTQTLDNANTPGAETPPDAELARAIALRRDLLLHGAEALPINPDAAPLAVVPDDGAADVSPWTLRRRDGSLPQSLIPGDAQ